MRTVRTVLAAAVTVALAGCSDRGAPAAPAASSVPTAAPTGVSLAPQVYLLRPDQLRGYRRTDDHTVSAATFAQGESDPAVSARLATQGYAGGATATYVGPGGTATGFLQVVSNAYLFRDAAGAAAFLADERGRRTRPPQAGGTVSPLPGMPRGGADELFALAAVLPPATPGGPSPLADLAVTRRGRVVAEVFAEGAGPEAAADRFAALVAAQEVLLGTSADLATP